MQNTHYLGNRSISEFHVSVKNFLIRYVFYKLKEINIKKQQILKRKSDIFQIIHKNIRHKQYSALGQSKLFFVKNIFYVFVNKNDM